MDIVDANARGRSGDESWAVDSGWTSRARRTVARMNPAQISAVLIVTGFVLVLASQWFPWVRVTTLDRSGSDFIDQVPKTMGMVNEGGFLQTPYYLLWLVVFGAGGVLVFTSGARRMIAFGVGAGALASELLIVLPLLHRPVDLLNVYGPTHAKITHVAGSYLVIAAFVVLTAAFVVGVEGRVFPGLTVGGHAHDDADAAAPAAPYPSMHDALAETLRAGEPTADIAIGWSPNRVMVGSEEIVVEEPEHRPAPRDHSQYRRPQPETAELPSFPTRGI